MAESSVRQRPEFNSMAADKLREMADLLERQQANPFRVAAYRRAADTVEQSGQDLRDILADEGLAGLDRLPNIGKGIAGSIQELARTGKLSRMERLRGQLEPEKLFQTVPGVGPVLARQIHEALGVDTLEELELAAHDGRLERVEGIGPRKARAIRATLESMLKRLRGRERRGRHVPDITLLLDVDREYRERAAAGDLPTIAPKRFNPEHAAWLPVLHADRDDWHFTVLFSNTARAHELGRTEDWVVVYFYDRDHEEGQHTIVTETRGSLSGRRVVRGREQECRHFYASGPYG